MANRSRREHKPPGKFLNFYITDEIKIHKVSPHRHTPSIRAAVPTRESIDLYSKKKTPAVTNCRSSKNARITDHSHVSTPPSISSNSSEIRRSNRRHKPSPKLRDYMQSPLDDRKSLSGALSTTTPPPNKKKVSQEVERRKYSTKKSVATISPMIRQGGIATPIMDPQNIAVELVDCFDALARDLAKSHPVSNDIVKKNASSPSQIYKQDNNKEMSADIPRDLKRSFSDDDSFLDRSLSKHQRLSPNIIRSLTRTKKSPKLMTSLQPTKFYSPPQRKTVVRSVSQSKPIKHYPLRKLSPETPSSATLPRLSSPRSVRHSPRLASLRLTEVSLNNNLRKKVCDSPQQGVKDSVKKILIMGTKVADSIAQTLDHNEADLSRSSAFEKRCLSLVQVLAKRGSDLEEEDMKNVLKLLEEEQEERRIYRQSFLKSLRFSHLTNMSLYTQMLQLLRTL